MDVNAAQNLGEAVGFLIMGGYAAMKLHRTERQTRKVGNGFADHVTDSLNDISDRLLLMDRRLGRLEDRMDRDRGDQLRATLERKRKRNAERAV